tara:strand:- start:115 stop:507 length:393 start_codon:yes stop_codon:yes gene_type:complete
LGAEAVDRIRHVRTRRRLPPRRHPRPPPPPRLRPLRTLKRLHKSEWKWDTRVALTLDLGCAHLVQVVFAGGSNLGELDERRGDVRGQLLALRARQDHLSSRAAERVSVRVQVLGVFLRGSGRLAVLSAMT